MHQRRLHALDNKMRILTNSRIKRHLFILFVVWTGLFLLPLIYYITWIYPVYRVPKSASYEGLFECSYQPPLNLLFPSWTPAAQLPVAHVLLQQSNGTVEMVNGVKLMENFTWKLVPNTTHYVFSAFWDTRKDSFIRIISIIDKYRKAPSFCRVWHKTVGKDGKKNESNLRISTSLRKLSVEIIPKGGRYVCSILHCDVSKLLQPIAVSVVRDRSVKETGPPMLKVVDRQPNWIKGKDRQIIGVCIQTPLFDYKNFLKLVEAFEMYKILGAKHVTLYNYTGDPVLNHVLQGYVAQGFLDVIPWPLPREIRVNTSDGDDKQGVHYYAELAAVQDCLYRNMHKFKYIVFMDTDEVIVPRKTRVWMKMIKSLPQDVAGYYFKKAEFNLAKAKIRKNSTGHVDQRLLKYHPPYILTRHRFRLIFEFNKKCCFKSIVRPDKIWTMSIHWAEKADGPMHETKAYTGLTHHYRSHPMTKRLQTLDPYMTRYEGQLMSNIDNFMQSILNVTGQSH
ncbi:uncharacterized protein LOC106175613 [Lingula anatina]|uniref:Glycosyltransferase family 92 protein n=1 Tax=Lingula anatina TaxID=7574 RepID=A0A1S3JSQ4_LINAN|nr:uncharacterized protein LOC106175613 [Lingula anatina]|eukprot:XP_013413156.1 uncharacterized protein LOC106175613 [Lingula anatina]